MNKIVIGILAHVDAGKTTLSEGILYFSGKLNKIGRVDNGDAYLDTHGLEKERGITIFAKQAEFSVGEKEFCLLDTPGHVDFAAEMERTLQVLDYAILVISGADGVQGHTKTVWKILERYKIPVFIFVNKMDQQGIQKEMLMKEVTSKLSEWCVDFGEDEKEKIYEQLALLNEAMLEEYLENGEIEEAKIIKAIHGRSIFPCFFGSALKLDNVEKFVQSLGIYCKSSVSGQDFGAKVFKIARDEQRNRLTYLRVTGGSLKVRDQITDSSGEWQEKITQIRIYSGSRFDIVKEAKDGTVCAVTGLNYTFPGQGLGKEHIGDAPVLTPILTYRIQLPEECELTQFLSQMKELEEEDPQLHIVWNEELKELHAQVMGEVQIEILIRLIYDRFGVKVEFDKGNIVYRETILNSVEGVGHFEPLRHYAEVHLLLEPGVRGSGLEFASDCSEDVLDRNWQRLVMTHLEEKEHKGVLAGANITDMKITLITGKAHQKHTEGGDFRQATYRALRQGLMEADSILLEPYYSYKLEIPEKMIGRAMVDIERMHGNFETPVFYGENAILKGSAPVVLMRDYSKEVIAYTKGKGQLFCEIKGYEPCHNQKEVLELLNYHPLEDVQNPCSSVFCAHGAGFVVSWDEVKNYMHLECKKQEKSSIDMVDAPRIKAAQVERTIGQEEIDVILSKTFYANSVEKRTPFKKFSATRTIDKSYTEGVKYKEEVKREYYLLVDGYNIIFAWEELRELAAINIESARGRLLDILCNYQGIVKCRIIVVFDAYRLKDHDTETFNYYDIHVVYTKTAETADQYIEKFAYQNSKKYHITVATSDGLEQIIIRGQGCSLLSARELQEEINRVIRSSIEEYQDQQPSGKKLLFDSVDEEIIQQLKEDMDRR